jgi:integrase
LAHKFIFYPHILDNLPVPSAGFDVVQDSVEPNLRMYITSRGARSFFVRKRINGSDRRVIIGNYPETEIEDARRIAGEILTSVAQKPKLHKKKTGFKKVWELYLLKKVRRSEKTKLKLIRSVNLHLSPLFEKNVQDISETDISDALSKISGCAISNRMHELLQSVFKFAIDKGYIKENPVSSVVKIKEQRRTRPLNKTGLVRLIKIIEKEKSQNLRNAFLMLVYGFAPKSKIFSMRWRDLDFNHYKWQGMPLSDKASVLLMDLPQNGKWVFTGRNGSHLSDPRIAWKKLVCDAKIPNLTMDDVYKFMIRNIVWASDSEEYRQNMNDLLENLLNKQLSNK